MDGELTVRRYESADAEAVLAVREGSLLAHGWEFEDDVPPDQEITDEFLGITSGVLEAGGEFLVGVHDGEIVAIGGFKPEKGETAELFWMGVHPEYQRGGYGERILVELEERAAANGFARLELETFERLTAAQRLYEKHGYETVRREADQRTGDDRIWYEKPLRSDRR